VQSLDWSNSSCMFIHLLLRHNWAFSLLLLQVASKNSDINDRELTMVDVLQP